jgi:hypothetical protein
LNNDELGKLASETSRIDETPPADQDIRLGGQPVEGTQAFGLP